MTDWKQIYIFTAKKKGLAHNVVDAPVWFIFTLLERKLQVALKKVSFFLRTTLFES